MDRFDIAVVGAGVAGLSAAYFCSEHARVVVLEREEQPAYHSSGRSAALYIEGYENPTVSRLTAASGGFFRTPPEGFSEYPLLHDRGGLTIAELGQDDALTDYLNTWSPHCPALTRLDAAQAQSLCPILRADTLSGAAYDPDWKSIDTHALMQGFQRGLSARGGELRSRCEVKKITRTQAWQIETSKGVIAADTLVNAAGAWAGQVAGQAGASDMALSPRRRTAAIVPVPDEARTWPVVHTISGNLYFKPESPGLMVCPQDETPSEPVDAHPEELDIAIALDRFTQVADLPVQRVMHQWAGLRTFAPDRRPIVGPDPRVPGFFWLAGQGGFGVQTSPELGRMSAACILHGTTPDADIAPQRFS